MNRVTRGQRSNGLGSTVRSRKWAFATDVESDLHIETKEVVIHVGPRESSGQAYGIVITSANGRRQSQAMRKKRIEEILMTQLFLNERGLIWTSAVNNTLQWVTYMYKSETDRNSIPIAMRDILAKAMLQEEYGKEEKGLFVVDATTKSNTRGVLEWKDMYDIFNQIVDKASDVTWNGIPLCRDTIKLVLANYGLELRNNCTETLSPHFLLAGDNVGDNHMLRLLFQTARNTFAVSSNTMEPHGLLSDTQRSIVTGTPWRNIGFMSHIFNKATETNPIAWVNSSDMKYCAVYNYLVNPHNSGVVNMNLSKVRGLDGGYSVDAVQQDVFVSHLLMDVSKVNGLADKVRFSSKRFMDTPKAICIANKLELMLANAKSFVAWVNVEIILPILDEVKMEERVDECKCTEYEDFPGMRYTEEGCKTHGQASWEEMQKIWEPIITPKAEEEVVTSSPLPDYVNRSWDVMDDQQHFPDEDADDEILRKALQDIDQSLEHNNPDLYLM